MGQPSNPQGRRVLAICSGGGHWVQMTRLLPAFEDFDTHFACCDPGHAKSVSPSPYHFFPDSNKDQKLRLMLSAFYILFIVIRVRPDVIVTTGAAGGCLAIMIGRVFGIRGIFIDSIANAKELSVSAKLSIGRAEAVLTQWPDVATNPGATFRGSVL